MRSILYFLLFTILAAPVSAAPITYQGQLQQSGQLVDGIEVPLSFQLFATEAGDDSLGAAIPKVVTPQNGLFQVELDFGAGAFDGSPRFLEILVNGMPLGERQAVLATPLALVARNTVDGAIGSSQIDEAQVQRRVTGACPVGQYVGSIAQDGTVDCGAEPAAWLLGGNANTDPATDFLGTTDKQALELRTANVRSLRIEPSAELFEGLPITANVIAGSHANVITPGVRGGTIAGGGVPSGDTDPNYPSEAPNRVTANYGVIGGGYGNQAGDDLGTGAGPFSTVGGGQINTASGNRSTVGGGDRNTASGDFGTVGGGSGNIASGLFSSTVGGGSFNIASGMQSTVGGGNGNTASGLLSTIGGGQFNCAGGSYSWAGGRSAKVRPATDPGPGNSCSFLASYPGGSGDEGTFVWADSQNANFVSSGSNQFLVRAGGGIYFGTDSTVSIPAGRFINTTSGAHLTTGGAWTNASSRALKTEFAMIDHAEVLGKVLALPLQTWRYRSSEAVRHLGPMAEDFYASFGLGSDAESISTVDASGVALAAIQGLNLRLLDENAALNERLEESETVISNLEFRLAALEALLLDDRQVAERLQ